MDGYALRAADGALGAALRVVGSAPAGHPWHGTRRRRARRCGCSPAASSRTAPTPCCCRRTRAATAIASTVRRGGRAGRHIRRAGQDFAAGDVLVPAGQRLSARDIGLAAAGNHPWLAVHRRPRVAILATGDEIALPGEPIPPGGIVSSNSHALAALVRARAAASRWCCRWRRDDVDAIAGGGRCRGRARPAGHHRRRQRRRPRSGAGRRCSGARHGRWISGRSPCARASR